MTTKHDPRTQQFPYRFELRLSPEHLDMLGRAQAATGRDRAELIRTAIENSYGTVASIRASAPASTPASISRPASTNEVKPRFKESWIKPKGQKRDTLAQEE